MERLRALVNHPVVKAISVLATGIAGVVVLVAPPESLAHRIANSWVYLTAGHGVVSTGTQNQNKE